MGIFQVLRDKYKNAVDPINIIDFMSYDYRIAGKLSLEYSHEMHIAQLEDKRTLTRLSDQQRRMIDNKIVELTRAAEMKRRQAEARAAAMVEYERSRQEEREIAARQAAKAQETNRGKSTTGSSSSYSTVKSSSHEDNTLAMTAAYLAADAADFGSSTKTYSTADTSSSSCYSSSSSSYDGGFSSSSSSYDSGSSSSSSCDSGSF